MEEFRDIVLEENNFIWNFDPRQPRDALGRWTGGGADYTFIEKKALGLLSTEQIRSYVRGKYPGKPKVVDGDTFDNLDGINIFRGVDNVAQAMDYVKSNKHFSTNEMQGITGHDFHEDFEVAKANRDAEAKIKRKYVVIQARLDTSRMTTYENLVQERNDYCPEQDLTTFAVDKGYSAVKIRNGTVVVLDKTATTVFDGSLQEYDDETFNNRKNNMDRIERLNNILERFENFNPYHDKLGRFTSGPGGAAGGTGSGEKVITGELDQPTIGVGGNESLQNGLTKVRTRPGLKGKAKALENEIVKCYNDPEKRDKIIKDEIARHDNAKDKEDRITYEVDALKEQLPGWNNVGGNDWKTLNNRIKESGYDSLSKDEKTAYDTMAENRMKYNTVYHNTAHALAKAAFEAKVAQLRATGEKVNIMMTGGGCGVGKGFGLSELSGKTNYAGVDGPAKVKQGLLKDSSKATLIYDAAGEACNSEAYWVMNLAISNGGKFTFMNTISTDANLTKSIAKAQAKRTQEKGRTVALKYTADSYSLGAKNAEKFYNDKTVQSLTTTGQVSIYTIKNPGAGNGALKLSEGIDISGSSEIKNSAFKSEYTTKLSGYKSNVGDEHATMNDKLMKYALDGLDFQ